MADPRSTNTRRAVLSYDQLKKLTRDSGFVWPELLIKDYQGIIQDFTFLADETDALELRVIQNEFDIAVLEIRVDDHEVRIQALEYRVFEVIEVNDDFQATEFEILICRNVLTIDVTLKATPLKGDEMHIKRTDGVVNVIGTVDGLVNMTINVVNYSMHLVYNGTDWSEI